MSAPRRVRSRPALLLSLQDKLKGERIRLNIAKSLGGDAIPHVRDRPLWERNVLGLDQEAGARAGARIYIFPKSKPCVFLSATLLSQWNVIGFPRF
jgi:hypothetical protein